MTSRSYAVRFRSVLGRLASDPAGWQSDAGSEFVELMTEVLARKAACVEAAEDVATEAVLVVDGPAEVTLADNASRILAMEKPLGYVIGAVSANLDRAALSDRFGVASTQVSSGVSPIELYDGPRVEDEQHLLESTVVEPAWARPQSGTSREAVSVTRAFTGVLVGRFRVKAAAVKAALEVAGDSAVDGEVPGPEGLTGARTRRRLGRFVDEAPALRRVGMSRRQVHAMAGLLFGSERHPEWSLLAECAIAGREGRAVRVSPWQADRARMVAARGGVSGKSTGRGVQPSLSVSQPSLFETSRTGKAVLRSA